MSNALARANLLLPPTNQADENDLKNAQVILKQVLDGMELFDESKIWQEYGGELKKDYRERDKRGRLFKYIMDPILEKRKQEEGKWRRKSEKRFKSLVMERLPKGKKKDFARALKGIPTVEALLAYHAKRRKLDRFRLTKGKKYWQKRENLLKLLERKEGEPTEWAGGGALRDDLRWADPSKQEPIPEAFRTRVDEADKLIKLLLEPEVLKKVKRPAVRPFAGESRSVKAGGAIVIRASCETTALVHEVGHYLEDNLPSDLAVQVHFLLRYRHKVEVDRLAKKKAGENRELEEVKKELNEIELFKEGEEFGKEYRFLGQYPATGPYTSRVGTAPRPTSAGTEVTSMTIEFLANPKKAKSLIQKDPVQAAIILRQLIPQEYQARDELSQFDKYLPGEPRKEE